MSGSLAAAYSRAQGGGSSSNSFGGEAQALVAFANPGLNLQFSGGDETTSGGGSLNTWVADGDFFWRDGKGSFGASVAHGSLSTGWLSADITAYGGFGEWYARRDLTRRIKGGGFSGDTSGQYGAVGAEYYWGGNLGLFADYTYVRLIGHSVSNVSGGVEWLVSRELPLSLRVGGDFSSGGGVNTTGFSVKLIYRFGLSGSLVDLDRTGPTPWNGALSAL